MMLFAKSFRYCAIQALLALLVALTPGMARAAVPTVAPEFKGIDQWLNSYPLTMQSLRGKVVLIDFWAYSCINCLRTLPHVNAWYDKYKDDGFVVIGVHTPEFKFGKSADRVLAAIRKYDINYPVALDSQMATWNAWSNRYWPAKYLVDRDGTVIMHHYGEGHYQEIEDAIRKALGLEPLTVAVPDKDFSGIGSPEMYFGLDRLKNLANKPMMASFGRDYELPESVKLNQFAFGGEWDISSKYAELDSQIGHIRLRFQASKVYMVAAGSEGPVTLQITVDGVEQAPVVVTDPGLYTLFDGSSPAERQIDIKVIGEGFRAYTFTFG